MNLPRTRLDEAANAIVEALGGVWHGKDARCRCPAHDDTNPSLDITVGKKAVLYFCQAGCTQSEVGSAIREIINKPLRGYKKTAKSTTAKIDYQELAVKVWQKTRPLLGSLGEIYLRSRKIDFLIPELRFEPECVVGSRKTNNRSVHPGIIAAIRDHNGITAIQRTLLRPDGLGKAEIEKPKMFLGHPKGGLGRWGPEPEHTLRLAEGNEDAASAMIIATHGIPVWPVYGIRRYGTIDIGQNIKHVIIYTQPGIEAAKAIEDARPHLTANNRSLEMVHPFGDGDWSDWLRAIRS
jgi:putative DNA primase/helicase